MEKAPRFGVGLFRVCFGSGIGAEMGEGATPGPGTIKGWQKPPVPRARAHRATGPPGETAATGAPAPATTTGSEAAAKASRAPGRDVRPHRDGLTGTGGAAPAAEVADGAVAGRIAPAGCARRGAKKTTAAEAGPGRDGPVRVVELLAAGAAAPEAAGVATAATAVLNRPVRRAPGAGAATKAPVGRAEAGRTGAPAATPALAPPGGSRGPGLRPVANAGPAQRRPEGSRPGVTAAASRPGATAGDAGMRLGAAGPGRSVPRPLEARRAANTAAGAVTARPVVRPDGPAGPASGRLPADQEENARPAGSMALRRRAASPGRALGAVAPSAPTEAGTAGSAATAAGTAGSAAAATAAGTAASAGAVALAATASAAVPDGTRLAVRSRPQEDGGERPTAATPPSAGRTGTAGAGGAPTAPAAAGSMPATSPPAGAPTGKNAPARASVAARPGAAPVATSSPSAALPAGAAWLAAAPGR